MAREMGRNCCVNWWRPHQRAETFPNLFFFFFFFFTTLTWFVSGKTGRTERRFKFCRLVLLPEWIRRRCHRPAPGKRRRRILWANTKWNCRDESTIWWAKKKMEATWVDCCCWTAFYSFDRRCRSFQMCLECWTESRWWAKMTATASRDLFWHEKRRRQTTKTKKTTRKTRNVHINRKRITSFLRITIFVFSKRFVDGLFFFFLFFCFLFFWNFEILAGKFIDIIKNISLNFPRYWIFRLPWMSPSSGQTGQHRPATLTGLSQLRAGRLGHSKRWHSILPDLHLQLTQSIGPNGPITGCQVVPCR